LAASNNQGTKAIEYGKQAFDAGAMRPNDLLIMSQLYYQQKDCKAAGIWGDRAIAAFKEQGMPPKEVLYQIKLQCAADASQTTAEISALYDLVRLTNKTSYWNNLLRLERQDERDDHNTLMIYRLMFDTQFHAGGYRLYRDGTVARRCGTAGRSANGFGKADEHFRCAQG